VFASITCQSQTQMSNSMCYYPSMFVQICRTTTAMEYMVSLMWGSWFIIMVIVIKITHLLAFRALVTTIIAPRFVPLSDISCGVSPTATSAVVLIIGAATATTLGPDTGVFIIAAIADSGNFTTLAGAPA
jgi:hypothetical protein